MKTEGCLVSVLFLCCWMRLSFGFPQAGVRDLGVGDDCTLYDKTRGKCEVDRQCPYAIDLWKKKKMNEIVKCGFHGRDRVVCCKAMNAATPAPILVTKPSACEGVRPSAPVRLTDHIVNGEQADAGEFPHMAAIGYDSNANLEFNCGGTLISANFVLTAAHCVNRRDTQPSIVRLGRTSLDLSDSNDPETVQDIKISKIIINEYSSKTRQNDIALLKLEKPAELKHNVWPACLAADGKGPIKNLTVIGFGKYDVDIGATSRWLLRARVDEMPLASCQESFKKISATPPIESQLCAHNTKTFSDTCQGDSGGPMTYTENKRFYVYGVTSYGLGCGSEFPSVYTRVDKYNKWINDNINS